MDPTLRARTSRAPEDIDHDAPGLKHEEAAPARACVDGGILREQIKDSTVVAIANQWPVGPVDQFRHLLWPATNRALLLRIFDQ